MSLYHFHIKVNQSQFRKTDRSLDKTPPNVWLSEETPAEWKARAWRASQTCLFYTFSATHKQIRTF